MTAVTTNTGRHVARAVRQLMPAFNVVFRRLKATFCDADQGANSIKMRGTRASRVLRLNHRIWDPEAGSFHAR